MQIETLIPDQLQLNPDNDRHGPLKSESAAIQWLLEHRTAHMRALVDDLASTKRLFEPPLVRADPTHGQNTCLSTRLSRKLIIQHGLKGVTPPKRYLAPRECVT
jgi:hypothetical protein